MNPTCEKTETHPRQALPLMCVVELSQHDHCRAIRVQSLFGPRKCTRRLEFLLAGGVLTSGDSVTLHSDAEEINNLFF